ncbi:MAG: histidine kinase [Desulfobaccales bacterium]
MEAAIPTLLLMVENPEEAHRLRQGLTGAGAAGYRWAWVPNLSRGLARLGGGGIDVVLLELDLPDSRGLDTLARLQAQAPRVPLVVLIHPGEEAVGLAAIRRGAQDYLIQGKTSVDQVMQVIGGARERHRMTADLRQARDELAQRLQEQADDRRQREERLHQWEAGLAEAQRLAHLGSWEWHIRTDTAVWSAELFRIFHLAPRSAGLTREEFLHYVHPDDRDTVQQAMTEALAGVKAFAVDFRVILDDGSICYLYSQAEVSFDEAGQATMMRGTLQDVTAHRQTEERLRESQRNLRHLAFRLMSAQEEERKRLSRELHDDLGQSLLVLKLRVGDLVRKLIQDPEAVRKDCDEILSFLDRVVNDVRRLSRDLSPTMVTDLGLSAALRRLVHDFSQHYHIELEDDIDEVDRLFALKAQVNLYRVFQESLTNIGKYAGATRVTVAIKRYTDRVEFLVADNGKGFDVLRVLAGDAASRGLGLAAMQERVRMLGGSLTIWSQEGAGTRISFAISLEKQLHHAVAKQLGQAHPERWLAKPEARRSR